MRSHDLEKLAKAVRKSIARFDRRKLIQLKPAQRKRLERMADDIDSVGASLASLNEGALELSERIQKLRDQVKQSTRPATKPTTDVDREQSRLINYHAQKSQDLALDPRARAEHYKLYQQLSRDQNSHRRTSQTLARSGQSLNRSRAKIQLLQQFPHALKTIQQLRELDTQNWLESVHWGILGKEIEKLGDLETEENSTLLQRVEGTLLKILQIPADLYGWLLTLLELRRKLAQLTLDTEEDLEVLLALADDIAAVETRARIQSKAVQKLLASPTD